MMTELQAAYDAIVRGLKARTAQVRQLQEEMAALRAQRDNCGLTHEQLGRLVRNSYIEGYEDCKAGKPPLEKRSNDPLTLEQLREMAALKPAVVWVVCLDADSGEPIPDTGVWEMFDGYGFWGEDIADSYQNYGRTFLAYDHEPGPPK